MMARKTRLPPPLDIYELVFWRSLYLLLWISAIVGTISAIMGFLSFFVDLPGTLMMDGEPVRGAEGRLAFTLTNAAIGAMGIGLLRVWRKGLP